MSRDGGASPGSVYAVRLRGAAPEPREAGVSRGPEERALVRLSGRGRGGGGRGAGGGDGLGAPDRESGALRPERLLAPGEAAAAAARGGGAGGAGAPAGRDGL